MLPSFLALILLPGCPRAQVPALHPVAGMTLVERGPATLLEAPAGGAVEIAADVDLLEVGALSLDVEVEAPCTVEVYLLETGRQTWFWRRVELDAGWQHIEIPLRWFRWRQRARKPSWELVDTLALRFREESRLALRGVAWEPGDPWLDAEDLVALRADLVSHASEDVVLLSTTRDEEVVDHLGRVAAFLEETLPFLPRGRTPVLVLLPDEGAYRRFSVRMAHAFHAEAGPPEHDGLTLQGIALAAREGEGEIRPSWTHEYAHAWLTARTGLPTGTGDWLHEGLAARVQLALHPQHDYDDIVGQGLAEPSWREPLGELLDGERVPTSRYWQAAEVLGFLLEEHEDALPALVEATATAGSTDLRPHLHLLGVDMDALEEAWLHWESERQAD